MAHILFVYKQFPAPSVGHAGGESLFGLMEGLHRRGHRLTLVARILDEEHRYLPDVEAICDKVYTVPHHRSLPGPRLSTILKSYYALRRTAAKVLRGTSPDLVHVETTQTAAILIGLRLPPSSFRTQDVNWFLYEQHRARAQGFARIKAAMIRQLFRWLEPWLWQRFDVLLAISEGDKRLLTPHSRHRDLLLVPLNPAMTPSSDLTPAVSTEPNIVFVGAMSRDHNINGVRWFLEDIWPRIHAVVPEAQFYIVGGAPPDAIRAYANGETIVVTGFVDDLAAWYRAATVFVSPMLVAGGLLQKVVDAMAMGIPVVATSVCNHGLSATPGTHLLTADTPETFANSVIRLLHEPGTRTSIGSWGRNFIETHYDIETAIDQWEQALSKLVHNHNH